MSLDRVTIPEYVVYCDVAGCTNGETFTDSRSKREAAKAARGCGWTSTKPDAGDLIWKCHEHFDHKWVSCKICDGTGGGLGYDCHGCGGNGVG